MRKDLLKIFPLALVTASLVLAGCSTPAPDTSSVTSISEETTVATTADTTTAARKP